MRSSDGLTAKLMYVCEKQPIRGLEVAAFVLVARTEPYSESDG